MTKISIWEFNQQSKKERSVINCYEHKGLIVTTSFKKGKMGVMTRVHRFVKTQYFCLWESYHKGKIEDYTEHLTRIAQKIDDPSFNVDERSVKAVLKQIGR